MHIKKDGLEFCTYCGGNWIASEKYPTLCDNCFCPESYCTLIDDMVWYQSGVLGNLGIRPLEANAMDDVRKSVEEQLAIAVPPVTWEDLCKNQPLAKRLFERKTNA